MTLRSCLSFPAAALLLAFSLPQKAYAQTTPTGEAAPTTVTAGPDSVAVRTPVVPDSVRRVTQLFGIKMTKPSKAGLLAALLPSAGQIYNRSWWKLPLVYGAVGGTIYGEIHYQRRYKEFSRAYNLRNDGNPATSAETEQTRLLSDATVSRGVNVFRRQRDTFVAYIGVAYAMQILDAVVDAHLRDFDISDDLSLRWDPTLLRTPTAATTAGLGLTFSFK